MSETDVSEAFKTVRLDPDRAHKFFYTVGDLVVFNARVSFRPRPDTRTATPHSS